MIYIYIILYYIFLYWYLYLDLFIYLYIYICLFSQNIYIYNLYIYVYFCVQVMKSTHRMEYEYTMGNFGHYTRLKSSCKWHKSCETHIAFKYVCFFDKMHFEKSKQNQKYHMRFHGRHEGTVWNSKNKYEFQKQTSRHSANFESSRTHAQAIDNCHSSDACIVSKNPCSARRRTYSKDICT